MYGVVWEFETKGWILESEWHHEVAANMLLADVLRWIGDRISQW
jgi:hypothetical protein